MSLFKRRRSETPTLTVKVDTKPEMIIPLDGMKSSRSFELLGKTAVAVLESTKEPIKATR